MLTSGAPATVAATRDSAAWAEILTAYRKLNALPGYRVKDTVESEGLTAIIEIVPGKASHYTIQEGGLTLEQITVGGLTRHRFIVSGTAGTWACDSKPMHDLPEPRDVQSTAQATRGEDTVIGGILVHTYPYSWEVLVAGRLVIRQATVYVGGETGLPSRKVERLVNGVDIFDYYDYGAKIEIILPACG